MIDCTALQYLEVVDETNDRFKLSLEKQEEYYCPVAVTILSLFLGLARTAQEHEAKEKKWLCSHGSMYFMPPFWTQLESLESLLCAV